MGGTNYNINKKTCVSSDKNLLNHRLPWDVKQPAGF